MAPLLASGELVHFTSQNIILECRDPSTRQQWDGFSVAVALVEIEKIERALTLRPDVPEFYAEWERYGMRYGACEATTLVWSPVHSAGRMLTFDTGIWALRS